MSRLEAFQTPLKSAGTRPFEPRNTNHESLLRHVLPVSGFAGSHPLDGGGQALAAGFVALGFGEPLDVLALVVGAEGGTGFGVPRERGREVGRGSRWFAGLGGRSWGFDVPVVQGGGLLTYWMKTRSGGRSAGEPALITHMDALGPVVKSLLGSLISLLFQKPKLT